LTSTKDYYKRN